MSQFSRILILFSLLFTISTAPGAPLERWVYAQVNLLVPAEVERLEALMRRAQPLGFTHFLLADPKFSRLGEMDARYHEHIRHIKKVAAELGIEIVPAIFPVGYSNSLLWHNPNLAEGLPVRDALFVVSNNVVKLVAEPPVSLPEFSERRRWGFIDENLRPDGNGLILTNGAGANARAMARITVSPFRQYHVSVRIKTEEFRGQPEIKVLVAGSRSLNFTSLGVKPTQDWRTHHITFNSLEHTNVNVYFGVWGAGSGSLWMADAKVEEAGPVNILRRTGCPLQVRIDGGRVLQEGEDFEPLRDSRMGNQPWPGEFEVWHEPPALKTKLPDGTRLRVSYFHPHIVYGGQICACPSEPEFEQLLQREAREMHQAWQVRNYFMSHDEWRVLGWDESCQRRELDAGEIVADNARKCVGWLRELNPNGRVLVWSDMFDPHHNAVTNYYLVRGDLRGAWEGLDRNVVIMNWNFGKRAASLKFFSDRGHQQILAGYYDHGPTQVEKWLESARDVPGVIGVMYTTWRRNYKDLEAFADVVDKFEKAQTN